MTIDRCICMAKPFAELVAIARRDNLDLQQLCDKTRAGNNCGLCKPYLRRALRTGQTVFHEIITE